MRGSQPGILKTIFCGITYEKCKSNFYAQRERQCVRDKIIKFKESEREREREKRNLGEAVRCC